MVDKKKKKERESLESINTWQTLVLNNKSSEIKIKTKIKLNHSYACKKEEGTNKRRGIGAVPYIRTW